MIATILPSSTTFHAVGYNERKVAKGQAVLLEMKNFGYVGAIDGYSPEQLQQYLIDYSARNGHIRKAQFHVAIPAVATNTPRSNFGHCPPVSPRNGL